MNEEILSGLRNAVARGFSLDDAAQSFMNSGYNPAEIKEAVYLISKGFSPLPTTKDFVVSKPQEGAPFAAKQEIAEPEKKKGSSITKWIIIILVALVILGILIPMLLFREQFLGVVDSIFP